MTKKRIPSFECTIVNKICNFALANRSYKLCHYLPEHTRLSKVATGWETASSMELSSGQYSISFSRLGSACIKGTNVWLQPSLGLSHRFAMPVTDGWYPGHCICSLSLGASGIKGVKYSGWYFSSPSATFSCSLLFSIILSPSGGSSCSYIGPWLLAPS